MMNNQNAPAAPSWTKADHPAWSMSIPNEWEPGSQLRDIYRARRDPNGTPLMETVTIEKREDSGWVEIYAYERCPSSYASPFHPFRQWKDGVWRHYGFITPGRFGFSVLDMESGTVIPLWNPRPMRRWEMQSFVAHQFWTYDFKPSYSDSDDSLPAIIAEEGSDYEVSKYDLDELEAFNNQFAIVSGSYQHDVGLEESVKYIDLSRLDEGIMTSDQRFGNIDISGDLDQMVDYSPQMKLFNFKVPHSFRMDGSLHWSSTHGLEMKRVW